MSGQLCMSMPVSGRRNDLSRASCRGWTNGVSMHPVLSAHCHLSFSWPVSQAHETSLMIDYLGIVPDICWRLWSWHYTRHGDRGTAGHGDDKVVATR